MNEIAEVARIPVTGPWYVVLAGGLFGAVLLMLWLKKTWSSQGVSGADDKAVVQSITIYQQLINELREQLKAEQAIRSSTESKYDELLQKYAGLTGEIASLRLTVEHQAAQITAQNELIVQLREQVENLRKERYVPTQD